MSEFVSRAGHKLDHAISAFALDVTALRCADLGCNVGGFVDCLLRRGASHVWAIDTGYGVLDWKLRNDQRVGVMERTNAMHAQLPQPVDLVTIDVAWTRQKNILPAAARLLHPQGKIISLIKPHYEAPPRLLRKGVLPLESLTRVLLDVQEQMRDCGVEILALTASPILGGKGNREFLALCRLIDS